MAKKKKTTLLQTVCNQSTPKKAEAKTVKEALEVSESELEETKQGKSKRRRKNMPSLKGKQPAQWVTSVARLNVPSPSQSQSQSSTVEERRKDPSTGQEIIIKTTITAQVSSRTVPGATVAEGNIKVPLANNQIARILSIETTWKDNLSTQSDPKEACLIIGIDPTHPSDDETDAQNFYFHKVVYKGDRSLNFNREVKYFDSPNTDMLIAGDLGYTIRGFPGQNFEFWISVFYETLQVPDTEIAKILLRRR